VPWSGGTFSRVHDWTTDAGSAINIEADRMDAEDDNFETGIDSCLHKGGQNSATGNLPMAGNIHTGVGNATARDTYASAADVQDQDLIYNLSGGSASAYTLTLTPAITAYEVGQRFVFKANHANTGASTLAVSGLAAKAIVLNDGSAMLAGMILSGEPYEVFYENTGDHFVLTSPHGLGTQTTLTPTDSNFMVGDGSDWVAESGATARGSLGLGTIATQASDNVSITGGSISGITDLAILDGGTGASTQGAARTNLGVAIGSDVQAHDAVLDDLAGLTAVSGANQFIVSSGAGAYAHETASQARTSLGLGDLATQNTVNNSDWNGTDLAIANGGTNAGTASGARTNLGAQAQDDHLDDLAALATVSSAGQVMVSTGSGAWGYQGNGGQHKIKTADETVNNSDTIQVDNHLAGFDVEPNSTYAIDSFIWVDDFGSGDLKLTFQYTVSPSARCYHIIGTDVNENIAGAMDSAGAAFRIIALSNAVEGTIKVQGFVTFGAVSSGTGSLYWAQNTASVSDLTFKAGSWMTFTKVA
jgi:hypothetical protein